MTKTKIYYVRNTMKLRCKLPSQINYKNYGGRGIKVLWNNFKEFYADMGESYKQHVEEYGERKTQIDRINNDGDYCKENCRRVTPKENSNNRRNNKKINL